MAEEQIKIEQERGQHLTGQPIIQQHCGRPRRHDRRRITTKRTLNSVDKFKVFSWSLTVDTQVVTAQPSRCGGGPGAAFEASRCICSW
ncbi:MAG: hypothetical protein ACKOEO_25085 [Planctomycetaceae bacterium]